ncbi:3-oxoadipate enol-lactonase, partial [Serratia marcescens]
AFAQRHPEQVVALVAALAAGNPQGYAACCEALARADLRAEVASMTRPMRVIAGEQDPVTTVADAEFLVANAPLADLRRLPASHISNIACPDLFNRCVVEFLTEKE